MRYNIYCDESCHLKNDESDIMVLGAIKCDATTAKIANSEILDIKEKYGIPIEREIKWSKVSPSCVDYYKALIDYFFLNNDLQFRGYVCRGKKEIREVHVDDYNTWYYKMYYHTLTKLIDRDIYSKYNIYLDTKDTIGYEKVQTLKTYLNRHYHKNIVPKIQTVNSSDIAILQLTDLLIGALSYKHRGLKSSKAKCELIHRFEEGSGLDLLLTVPKEKVKANWFVWTPDTWR